MALPNIERATGERASSISSESSNTTRQKWRPSRRRPRKKLTLGRVTALGRVSDVDENHSESDFSNEHSPARKAAHATDSDKSLLSPYSRKEHSEGRHGQPPSPKVLFLQPDREDVLNRLPLNENFTQEIRSPYSALSHFLTHTSASRAKLKQDAAAAVTEGPTAASDGTHLPAILTPTRRSALVSANPDTPDAATATEFDHTIIGLPHIGTTSPPARLDVVMRPDTASSEGSDATFLSYHQHVHHTSETPASLRAKYIAVPHQYPQFWNALQESFPGAMSPHDFLKVLDDALNPLGFNRQNTLPIVSLCRDEMTRPFFDEIQRHWCAARKEFGAFNMCSLAGVVFCGKTGLKAADAHAPKIEGMERYLYIVMPHIAIGEDGSIGGIRRYGREERSSACGALIKFLSELKAGKCETAPPLDEEDIEQSLLESHLWRLLPKDKSKMDLVALTKLASHVGHIDMKRIIEKVVDENTSAYVMVTGVQVHGPLCTSWIWPSVAYAKCNYDTTDLLLNTAPGHLYPGDGIHSSHTTTTTTPTARRPITHDHDRGVETVSDAKGALSPHHLKDPAPKNGALLSPNRSRPRGGGEGHVSFEGRGDSEMGGGMITPKSR
eukprot:CAMPEP_0184659072 /NCGR_PEP_ID=MMETSP0308-20130426/28056_1 /TAXON_ID=38269 /ORGANISM="Gloeochaete witrockiana, Strain SAG 46.84" /LENGTH=610 /DNA_ID=CAMNT_0027098567 /DNA_START=135 /DNA_END=1963 /DNA_ORIENTATION=-